MTDIVDRLRAAALGVADAYARSLIRVGADEIERLRAERDALRAELILAHGACDILNISVDQLAVERDALRADAERYRFVREYALDSWDNRQFHGKRREDLDDAIDAAREQSNG